MRTACVAGLFLALASLQPAHPAGVSVVTSTTVLADLVRAVGGERVQVTALTPAGADPHTFQPTPRTMRSLEQASAVFFNGSGLEEWWGRAVRAVGRPDVPVIELSRGLATLRQPGQGRQGDAPDPHAWLDPTLVRSYIDRIRDALSRADAGNAAFYAERAAAYQGKLDELDAWIRAQVQSIPPARRRMVTFHNAFQYFGKRYGMAVDFLMASPAREPSARALAELARRIKEQGVPAVFAEADFNPKLLELLARDVGVKVVTNLYDGSLSDGPPAETYLNLMRHNVRMIVEALK